MILFEQKWLYSGKSYFSRVGWFYSGEVVVFGQKLLYSSISLYSGKTGCIRAKWLYLDKRCCIWSIQL